MGMFLWGAQASAALIASMFFLRFWTQTRDRLFALFSAAFLVFALNWLLIAVYPYDDESRHEVFFVRLFAFLLIIAGIIDKNRRPT